MKRVFYLFTSILIVSCSNVEKCQFNKLTKVTYNLNDGRSSIIATDVLDGCYSITKANNEATLKDTKRDFSIHIKTNPNEFHVTDDGSEHIWKEVDGFKLGNEMIGDTLILKYFPTENTPSSVLQYGIVYKFYN